MQQSILALAALELQTAKGLAIFTKEHTGFVQASLLPSSQKRQKKTLKKKPNKPTKLFSRLHSFLQNRLYQNLPLGTSILEFYAFPENDCIA